ncbi:MAG: tetratricopeptide repeat protein [Promethearchaeota archaeon]
MTPAKRINELLLSKAKSKQEREEMEKIFDMIDRSAEKIAKERKELKIPQGDENNLSAKELYEIGHRYSMNGLYQKAIDYYEKSLKIDSKNNLTWNKMGLAYALIHNLSKSVECLEKAIELKPDDVESLDVLLSHYYSLRNEEKAQKTWDRILEHSLNYGNHCALRGEQNLRAGNVREAFQIFIKGLRAKPDYEFLKQMIEVCLNHFGHSLKDIEQVMDSFNGDYKQAAEFCRNMAKQNPVFAMIGDFLEDWGSIKEGNRILKLKF